MRATKPWVQALNIDPHKVTAWALEVPRHESVTFWCLERGHLRSKDYFEWAREHYGLAQVSEDYFRQPANRDLWFKIHTVANWSPELLPLEEWDGVVFVACVEPPEDIQWSFPVQYVLATASDLKNHWERLQAEPTRVSMPAIDLKAINLNPVAAPTPTPVEPPPPKMPEINLAATVSPPVAEVAAPPTKPTAPPSGVSEGVKVDFSLNLNTAPAVTSEPMDNDVSDAPTGLSLKIPDLKSSEPASVAVTDAPEGLSIPEDHAVFEQDDIPTGIHVNPLLKEPVEPLPPPPKTAQPVMSDDTTGFTLINKEPKNEGAIDSDSLAPARFEAAKNDSERLAWIFQQLKQHFKFSWVMYINNEKLVPWKWDKAVLPKSQEAHQPVDLQQPSLFRVVFRTKMPYHGPVISNLINTSFFKNWGLKATPAHVTAVPVVMDGALVAMLIAAGNTPEQSDQALRFVEKLTPAVIAAMSQRAAA